MKLYFLLFFLVVILLPVLTVLSFMSPFLLLLYFHYDLKKNGSFLQRKHLKKEKKDFVTHFNSKDLINVN